MTEERARFEAHWLAIRGKKKAERELVRHPAQPQCYIQDSANRHWVTWQAAVSQERSKREPLTDEQIETLEALCIDAIDSKGWGFLNRINFARAIERAHGIGEQG